MNIQDIKNRLIGVDNVHFYGLVSQAAIDAAQSDLDVIFPPEYRLFLSTFGCGGVASEEFIGLGGPEHLDVVRLKHRLAARRNPLPGNLLPLRSDGGGNYDCFDVNRPTENGEFAVVEWQHDGGDVQVGGFLARSYFEWFESVLRLIEEA